MNIGGVYTDPFHSDTENNSSNIFGAAAPWYGGIRLCGQMSQQNANKDFVCIGNDDGVHFWTLKGSFLTNENAGQEDQQQGDQATTASARVQMDFTPKAPGVGLLQCSLQPGALSFLNENNGETTNTWSRLKATPPDFTLVEQTVHDAFNNINGLYVDLTIFRPGSFAGIRVVSDRLGKFVRDEVCVVGTDNGQAFWAIEGGSFDKQARNTSSSTSSSNDGGTPSGTGKLNIGRFVGGSIHNGNIQFENGSVWTKMAVGSCDLHQLPKEAT